MDIIKLIEDKVNRIEISLENRRATHATSGRLLSGKPQNHMLWTYRIHRDSKVIANEHPGFLDPKRMIQDINLKFKTDED